MRRTATAPALICLALLAGCAGGTEEDDAGAGGSPSASAGPSSSESGSGSGSASPSSPGTTAASPSGRPFPADLRPDDGGPGSGNGLGVTGVRVGQQDGFDRVVFDLDGTGEPGWIAEYVDEPRADGSGDLVEIDGSVYLQVVLRGLGLPSDTGVEELGTTRVPGAGGVAEVVPGGVFEGQQLALIGLTGSERPFRVFALTDPARVVVDVQRP